MKIKRMTTHGFSAALLGIVLVCSLLSYACSAQAAQPQKYCPIMGGEIDKSVYLDHEDKRVYFCCAGCKTVFLNNPDKVINDMSSKGIVLDKSPGK